MGETVYIHIWDHSPLQPEGDDIYTYGMRGGATSPSARRARPGRLSALSVFYRKLILYGGFAGTVCDECLETVSAVSLVDQGLLHERKWWRRTRTLVGSKWLTYDEAFRFLHNSMDAPRSIARSCILSPFSGSYNVYL